MRYRSVTAGRRPICAPGCASWPRSGAGSAIGACCSCCRREGTLVNHKKLRRLYREERLQVRRRGGRKRALGTRAPMAMPQGAEPALVAGLRERHARPTAGGSASWPWWTTSRANAWRWWPTPRSQAFGSRVSSIAVIAQRGTPGIHRQRQRHRAHQHGDPALVARHQDRMALHRARQADPERLHRELQRAAARRTSERDACSRSLAHAREALAAWKDDYNTVRPHSAIGNMPPAHLRQTQRSRRSNGTGRLSCHGAPRPVPLHHRACRAQMRSGSTSGWMKEGAQVTWI